MADRNKYIDEFINKMYGLEREQPIERLILSLDSLPILLNIPIRNHEILGDVKRKMYEHRGIRVGKKIMKKLIEVIIDSARTNRVNLCDLESTFKDTPPYDLDTNNTIILPEIAQDETQYEFKSILEDVEEGANNLAEKTQCSLDINIGVTDKFIQDRKHERQRRLEELKEIRGMRNTNILPQRDSFINWAIPPRAQKNEKCSDIISRINQIIEKSEKSEVHHPANEVAAERVKKLETYEANFNSQILTLLNELSSTLAKKPSAIPISCLQAEPAPEYKKEPEKEALPVQQPSAAWKNALRHGGIGALTGIFAGMVLMYKMCENPMPY
ncbi:uncharacterized protein NEMAJ01_1086 [Nematocida major]|uniref:uncharacterized protein n=1 Tax=Nematocida major TaxID=1912982 RepID=UPI0020076EFD|nr:uncharacterized protein NEMAJ01_1086 [Nematocida major]KAH9386190.1 hypothetical protein NEMAJ01_1086 [Nematocida major]